MAQDRRTGTLPRRLARAVATAPEETLATPAETPAKASVVPSDVSAIPLTQEQDAEIVARYRPTSEPVETPNGSQDVTALAQFMMAEFAAMRKEIAQAKAAAPTVTVPTPRRSPGRPRKDGTPAQTRATTTTAPAKRGPGRPPRISPEGKYNARAHGKTVASNEPPKRGPGRPPKVEGGRTQTISLKFSAHEMEVMKLSTRATDASYADTILEAVSYLLEQGSKGRGPWKKAPISPASIERTLAAAQR